MLELYTSEWRDARVMILKEVEKDFLRRARMCDEEGAAYSSWGAPVAQQGQALAAQYGPAADRWRWAAARVTELIQQTEELIPCVDCRRYRNTIHHDPCVDCLDKAPAWKDRKAVEETKP